MLRCVRCAVGAGQMFYSKDGECGNAREREMCQGRWNILGYHFIKRQPSLNGTSIYLRIKKAQGGEVIRQLSDRQKNIEEPMVA